MVCNRFILVLILFVFLNINAATAAGKTSQSMPDTIASPKPLPLKELKLDIESLLDSPDFSNAQVGIAIQSLESGEYILKKNESKNFIPASTQKILTTAAALEYLGPQFHYYTYLYLDGEIHKNGEFQGNIIIRGSGDPTISSYFNDNPADILDKWVVKLDSIGIKSIRGNIIGDDDCFDDFEYGPGWAWDDVKYNFSSQIGALSFNNNAVDIYITPAKKIGDVPQIRIDPDISYIKVINNIVTGPENEPTQIEFNREIRANIVNLWGVIGYDTNFVSSEITVTINNPNLYFINLFKSRLNLKKIQLKGSLLSIDDVEEGINYSRLTPFCEYKSPPLSEIIKIVNKYSVNFISDMLLKTVAKETTGRGSFQKGIEQVKKFVSRNGIDPEKINLVDGSGLSRYNLISPMYQLAMLSSLYKSPYRNIFIESLAEPGKKGTLSRRMTDSRAESSVKAKTGTLNGVSTFCGYVTSRDKEIFAVSIMMNNFTVPLSLATNLQDLICMRLASFSRKNNSHERP